MVKKYSRPLAGQVEWPLAEALWNALRPGRGRGPIRNLRGSVSLGKKLHLKPMGILPEFFVLLSLLRELILKAWLPASPLLPSDKFDGQTQKEERKAASNAAQALQLSG
eukprot:2046880-Amphidinium_carterae.1